MTRIISLTGYSRDSLIRVKVRATNAQGTGEYSELNSNLAGATIETIPTGNLVVTVDMSEESTTNVKTRITWTPLTGSDRGGANVNIINYEVFMAGNLVDTNQFESLGYTTDLEKIVTGLSGGKTYKFKVQGINKYGSGPDSPVVTMLTS